MNAVKIQRSNQFIQLVRLWTSYFLDELHIIVVNILIEYKELTLNQIRREVHEYGSKEMSLLMSQLQKACIVEEVKKIDKDKRRERKTQDPIFRINHRIVEDIRKIINQEFKAEIKRAAKGNNDSSTVKFICKNCLNKYEQWQIRKYEAKPQCPNCFSQKIEDFVLTGQVNDELQEFKAVIVKLQACISNIDQEQQQILKLEQPVEVAIKKLASQLYVQSIMVSASQAKVLEVAKTFPRQEQIPRELLRLKQQILLKK